MSLRARVPALVPALLLALVLGGQSLRAQLPAVPASSPERIRIGGYAGITLTRPSDSSRVQVAESNLAAIVSGSVTSYLSYLAELDAVSSSRENYAGRQDDRQLELARFYAELSRSDLLRLRVGRFLTPVGQWNEIHAEPLTWTAVRPLTTYRSFAKYSTGALLAGQGSIAGRDAGYALWFAPGWRADDDGDEEQQFNGAAGARVAMEALPGLWLGASGGRVRERRPESEYDDDSLETPEPPEGEDEYEDDERVGRSLMGVDLTARARGFEFRAEALWLSRGGERPEERSAFAQLAAPLVGERLFLLGRVEQANAIAGRTVLTRMVGLHWRAPARVVIKLELHDAGTAPRAVANGWFVSVSSFF